jgi:mannose-6-phosphate isomerase-like protein (cupin superfamily)
MNKVNLTDAFATFSEAWSPRIAGDINDMQIKLAKFRGAFDWHRHEQEDELFLVISGRMRMGLRHGDVIVDEGEFIIVPRGVEHRPEALSDECHVVLLEPASTINTGAVVTARTVRDLERLQTS